MSISTVKQRLLDKLQGLSTIAVVSGYDTAAWNAYPAAALTIAGGNAYFETTHHHNRKRSFSFRVYVDRTTWDEKVTQDLAVNVLDEIETALDADVTLSGAVNIVQPVSWTTSFEIREFDIMVLDVKIEADEVVKTR